MTDHNNIKRTTQESYFKITNVVEYLYKNI
jgi:hypothetical protein